MRISDWSSDVCSSDLPQAAFPGIAVVEGGEIRAGREIPALRPDQHDAQVVAQAQILDSLAKSVEHLLVQSIELFGPVENHLQDALIFCPDDRRFRSEEHTSELQSLMRISYAVFCLKKKRTTTYKNR